MAGVFVSVKVCRKAGKKYGANKTPRYFCKKPQKGQKSFNTKKYEKGE